MQVSEDHKILESAFVLTKEYEIGYSNIICGSNFDFPCFHIICVNIRTKLCIDNFGSIGKIRFLHMRIIQCDMQNLIIAIADCTAFESNPVLRSPTRNAGQLYFTRKRSSAVVRSSI